MPITLTPEQKEILRSEIQRQVEQERPAPTRERPPLPEQEITPPQWAQPQQGIQPTPWATMRRTEPQIGAFTPQPQPIPQPKVELIEKPKEIPTWQRALKYFAVPFEWVDETLIKPGLALSGTATGIVEEVERKPGEDFWEWKKRSWAGWETPGIDISVPWSEDPLRLDVRGVLELAPWLLIPGAGQVGGGLRAARGVSGLLGRLGTIGQKTVLSGAFKAVAPAGRVLGYGVEYSPWGLVEKTAGVALKGGFRAAGKVSERVSTAVGEKLFGKYVPPPVPASVQKLTKFAKEVIRPARKEFKTAIKERLRPRQEAMTQQILASYRKGEIPFSEIQKRYAQARKGALAPEFAFTPEALAARQVKAIAEIEARMASGELTQQGGKALITKLEKSPAYKAVQFTKEEAKELHDLIVNGVETGLVKSRVADDFLSMVLEGTIPQPYSLGEMKKVFGSDFAKAIGQLRGMSTDKVERFIDTLNIGRSLQASMDLSGTLRQGLILSLLHPTQTPKWFGRQVKALFSEKWSSEIDDAMKASPQFKEIMAATKSYMAPLTDATIHTGEELFASSAARRIPGIRRSERAFVTYLNQARWTSLEAGYNAMKAQGATAKEFELFGKFIDLASGRGVIPKSLEKFSPVFNAMLFSPRLQAATLQLPRQIGRMLLSKNPYMRKEAAKSLITFVGGGSAVLGLLNATGNKVELDPRSGDFGKIKIGETRLDIWRGYLQYSRFAAQMLTGERKSAYGNINEVQRGELAWRFLQSKSSPAFGLMVDLLRDETYMGKPIFDDTTGFSKAAKERVLPLALQDVIDAMEMDGMNGLWVAAPAGLGVGALTYVNDLVLVKQEIAKEAGYDSWDDIDPKTQREIENRNTELQTAYIEFDRQVMGTAWGDWRGAGNAVEDVFRENVEKAIAQYREEGDGVQFRGKVGDAFMSRRGGYDARSKEIRFEDIVRRLESTDLLESAVELGPEQMAIRTYNDALYGDEMHDEFGDYRFDEAEIRKQQLRQQLGDERFDYVEEYRGLKFENFPPEFQELIQAKIVMRPYWQVESNYLDLLFGGKEPRTKSGIRRLDRLVSRQRKKLRRENPDIEAAYNQFYKQSP